MIPPPRPRAERALPRTSPVHMHPRRAPGPRIKILEPYVSMSNDTKLEAKLHFFSSFIGLEFRESGFSFEFGGNGNGNGGGHTPLPLSCYTTLLEPS